ncbi:hypothetical protein [Nocardioides zeae]
MLGPAVALGACQEDSEREADPSPPATSSTTTATVPTEDAWRDEFTADQLAAYDGAIAAFETYEQQETSYWAAGVSTPEASEFFARWWFVPNVPENLLATYESADVTVEGRVTVLESRAELIDDDASEVDIVQCVDPTTRVVRQGGTPAPDAATAPIERTVQLARDDEGRWRLRSLPEGDQPC